MNEPKPISDAELLYWDRFCTDLRDRILLARMEGKSVLTDVQPDYVLAGIGGRAVGALTGLTRIVVVL